MHRGSVRTDDALALLHFGFREIVREPDAVLAERGLARLHHRILYMCRRNAGPTIADLLALLGITKQAMNRPLRELVEQRLVESTADAGDRRSRRLRLTPAGKALEFRLSETQRRAFARAFREAGGGGTRGWATVMRSLANGRSELSLTGRDSG